MQLFLLELLVIQETLRRITFIYPLDLGFDIILNSLYLYKVGPLFVFVKNL